MLPDGAGGLFRVGGDLRLRVVDLRQALFRVVRGPPGIAVDGEPRPCGTHLCGQRFGLGGRAVAEQGGGLPAVQVAEDERNVEAVAGAEDAAQARGGPGQLVDVRPAAGVVVRLGEVQARHAEQPVRVDRFVQQARTLSRTHARAAT